MYYFLVKKREMTYQPNPFHIYCMDTFLKNFSKKNIFKISTFKGGFLWNNLIFTKILQSEQMVVFI